MEKSTQIQTFTTEQAEKLAIMVRGTFVTADRGAIVLGKDFCKNQSGKIQRTVEGSPSETLGHLLYNGDNQWRVEDLSEEVEGVLKVLSEDQPCFQNAVDFIHGHFWVDDDLRVGDVYKAAKKAGTPQEWLDAFVLAKLNYQVGNGGFSQWVDNGYATLYLETREALTRIGTESAWVFWSAITSLERYFDRNWRFKEEMSSLSDDEDDDDYYSPGYDRAHEIDDEFDYAFSDKLVDEVERYVMGLPLNRVDPPQGAKDSCRYPNVKVDLVDQDGNAMVIIGRVTGALRRAGVPKEKISLYCDQAMAGDYNHLLRTTMEWVTVN